MLVNDRVPLQLNFAIISTLVLFGFIAMVTRRALLSLVPGLGVSAFSPGPSAPQSAKSTVNVKRLRDDIASHRTYLDSLYEWHKKADNNQFYEPYQEGMQQLTELAEERLNRLLKQEQNMSASADNQRSGSGSSSA